MDKMRGKLANIAKQREEFELQKKSLEEQMNVGRQNMGRIKKGLKNNEILDEPIEVAEIMHTATNAKKETKKPSNVLSVKENEQRKSVALKDFSMSLGSCNSPSINSSNTFFSPNSTISGGGGVISGSGVPVASVSLMPSGARVSEWCFTGELDSSPPVFKSQELYENIRLLGRGAFGEVTLVKNTDDNKLFAVKTMFCAKDHQLNEGTAHISLSELFAVLKRFSV